MVPLHRAIKDPRLGVRLLGMWRINITAYFILYFQQRWCSNVTISHFFMSPSFQRSNLLPNFNGSSDWATYEWHRLAVRGLPDGDWQCAPFQSSNPTAHGELRIRFDWIFPGRLVSIPPEVRRVSPPRLRLLQLLTRNHTIWRYEWLVTADVPEELQQQYCS